MKKITLQILILLVLASCGSKGKLYLPEQASKANTQ